MDNQAISQNNSTNRDNNLSNVGMDDLVEKKKINVLAIVFGVVALLFAGVAVFFGVKYFEPKEEDEPIVVEQIKEEVKTEIVIDKMASDYKEVVKMVDGLTANIDSNQFYYQNSNDLMYKPVGLNTFIPMRLTVEKKIVNSDSGEANVAILKSRLESAGFESIGTLPNLGSAPVADEYGYLDSSRNIVCSVFEDEEWTSPTNGYQYALLRCAKTDWSWLTDEDKSLIADLEVAYREKTGNYPLELDVGVTREVKDSEYAPYQTLTVGLKGAVGLFYRTSPDAKWQFFAGVQAPLECSEYNTEDLKKAYVGSICYDGGVESTVQP